MPTLIDGYNLAHASGILAHNIGPGTLERARDALIGFLAAALTESERTTTTIVFDAKSAAPDQPCKQTVNGINVVFAVGYETADALVEELIRDHSAPRQLVVVSSDHHIQRAAKRRRATPIDSETWFSELQRRRRQRLHRKHATHEKPSAPETEAEIDYWLQIFEDELPTGLSSKESGIAAVVPDLPVQENGPLDDPKEEIENPFPPGYGEDLLIDDDAGES